MKLKINIKKFIVKFGITIIIILVTIPLFMFGILSAFFILFHIGVNSDIELIEKFSYKINDIVTEANYYDTRIIKDEIVLNSGKFVITKNNDKFNLIMYIDHNKTHTVLTNGSCWDISDNKVYFIGDSEFAVIYTDDDNKDKCKILIENDDYLLNELNKYYDEIEILNSFEDFTKSEQNILINIKNNGSIFVN